MIISRRELAVRRFAKGGKENKDSFLNSVYISEDKTVSTDGHILAICKSKPGCRFSDEEWPSVDNEQSKSKSNENNGLNPFVISAEEVDGLVKTLPQSATIPILNNIKIDNEYTNKNTKAKFITTNLKETKETCIPKLKAKYPDYTVVVEKYKDRKPKVKITVDNKYLLKLAGLVKAALFNNPQQELQDVTLSLYGEEEVIKAEFGNKEVEFECYIMPIKKRE